MPAFQPNCSSCGQLKIQRQDSIRKRYICLPCAQTYHKHYAQKPQAKLARKQWRKDKRANDVTFRTKEYQTNSRYKVRRAKIDPLFKLRRNLSSRLSHFVKRTAMKKTRSVLVFLGCSWTDFVQHIEKQFQPGMTWKNYGKWHVDHIHPLSVAKTEQELFQLNHFSNLQPLWAVENIQKGNRI